MTQPRQPSFPVLGGRGAMTCEAAAALVETASGVGTGAIEALEQVVTRQGSAQAGRRELAAAWVTPELLRQVSLARSGEHT